MHNARRFGHNCNRLGLCNRVPRGLDVRIVDKFVFVPRTSVEGLRCEPDEGRDCSLQGHFGCPEAILDLCSSVVASSERKHFAKAAKASEYARIWQLGRRVTDVDENRTLTSTLFEGKCPLTAKPWWFVKASSSSFDVKVTLEKAVGSLRWFVSGNLSLPERWLSFRNQYGANLTLAVHWFLNVIWCVSSVVSRRWWRSWTEKDSMLGVAGSCLRQRRNLHPERVAHSSWVGTKVSLQKNNYERVNWIANLHSEGHLVADEGQDSVPQGMSQGCAWKDIMTSYTIKSVLFEIWNSRNRATFSGKYDTAQVTIQNANNAISFRLKLELVRLRTSAFCKLWAVEDVLCSVSNGLLLINVELALNCI